MVFEASGYYVYHPFALERIAHDMPSVKLVVMLRDPVERAFSAYKHELARGFERESFEKALELEDSRLAGEIDRMQADPRYESVAHRHHSYRRRGHYAEQLERTFRLFPREQVHVIDSEAFFAEPASEYERVLAFLARAPEGAAVAGGSGAVLGGRELARYLAFVEAQHGAVILTGLGVTELSMSIPSVAAVKAHLRGFSLAKARVTARQALACSTAAEVRALGGKA